MHFLLTNDDGIHAPGLAAMIAAVQSLPGATYTVVAPHQEQSQCGHRVTTHQALRTAQLDNHRYSVEGTPADCVRVALFGLGIPADYVLSGVNAGGNMGQDIVISGTVAGVREGAYHGLPGLALSHYMIREIPVDWERVARWAAALIQQRLQEPLADGEFWNMNLPHLPPGSGELPPRVQTRPCRSPLPAAFQQVGGDSSQLSFTYQGCYADRPRDPGSDVEACFGGQISVSRLSIE